MRSGCKGRLTGRGDAYESAQGSHREGPELLRVGRSGGGEQRRGAVALVVAGALEVHLHRHLHLRDLLLLLVQSGGGTSEDGTGAQGLKRSGKKLLFRDPLAPPCAAG